MSFNSALVAGALRADDTTSTTNYDGCHLFGSNGCGFSNVAPSADDFDFVHRPIFSIAGFGVTKPILLAVIIVAAMIGFFWAAFAKPKLVPRGVQNVGEVAYLFVRDRI